MTNLTTVGLTSGAGTSGTGTVSTLDNVIGTAGTPSAQVQTVQGITSMTALKVDGSAVTQPVSGTVSVTGVATSALQTTGNTSLSTIATNTGSSIVAGTAVIGKVGIDQTSVGTTNAVSLAQVGTTTVSTGNGTSGAGVQRVAIASDNTAFSVNNSALTNFGAGEYETVAASATDQILGATGAVGDYLSGILITPTTTAAGSVSIKDGNGSSIPIFNTGTLSNLVPFFVPLGMVTVNATTPGWKVTTGTNVTVIGIGNFT